MAATASNASRNWPLMRAASSGPPNSEMSAPAAKILSPPVTTTAPGGSAVNPRAASVISPSTATERALAGGRSSRNTATPSSLRSSRTNSLISLRTLTAVSVEQTARRRVGVEAPLDDLVQQAIEVRALATIVGALLHALADDVAQLVGQPLRPTLLEQAVLGEEGAVLADRRPQFVDTVAGGRDSHHDRRRPVLVG